MAKDEESQGTHIRPIRPGIPEWWPEHPTDEDRRALSAMLGDIYDWRFEPCPQCGESLCDTCDRTPVLNSENK